MAGEQQETISCPKCMHLVELTKTSLKDTSNGETHEEFLGICPQCALHIRKYKDTLMIGTSWSAYTVIR